MESATTSEKVASNKDEAKEAPTYNGNDNKSDGEKAVDANVDVNESGNTNGNGNSGAIETNKGEYDPANEEPADYGELDYDYKSIPEKIRAGTRAKERGNALYKKGKYELAWKEYDRAFVHIYTSKEEWEAIGVEWRTSINLFKLPVHLNRGLCRLKERDLENALWDFSEALRIDENNVKGLYRRALVLTQLIRDTLASKEAWNLEKTQERADSAKADLMKAVKISPNDPNIRTAITDVKEVRALLREENRKYRKDQKKLYTGLIANLDIQNQRLKEKEDAELLKDMPKLERVRIC